MKYATITRDAAGSSPWLPLENSVHAFPTSIGCVVTGTVTYAIEYTYDNVLGGETPTVWTHATITGKTANFDGVITSPVNAIRLTLINFSSGTVTAKVIQNASGQS